MRRPSTHTAEDGTRTYKVRYRSGGRETSETFRRLVDAEMFAGILGDGRDNRVLEALAWLDAKQSEARVATFGQWFDSYVDELTGVTPRTRDDYRAMRRRYLTELDPLPLPLITRSRVALIVNRLEAENLSAKTIKNAVQMLSSVLAAAVSEGHIPRNPVHKVRLPKAKLNDSEVKYLTIGEAAALIDATPGHYQPLVTFLLGTGLRWSEATALQSRHVDLSAGTVRVQRAWKRIPGGWEVGVPKSEKSKRTVNAAVDALVAVAPLMGRPNDLLFTTTTGGVVRHSNFYNRIWVPSCERAGLDPRPTIHDCRSTFASWLISDGIGLEAVQEQLGHESYETTRKAYAHLMPAVGVAAGRSASAAMARVLANRVQVAALAIEPGGRAQESADPDHPATDLKRGGDDAHHD